MDPLGVNVQSDLYGDIENQVKCLIYNNVVAMDKYIAYLTTVADVTQRSPETIGEAFKTVFSRMGNVKLGRYTASQEEMASEDYNEEEWENLSDVETALDNIGIKLRKNTQEYRETDDVLEDIHEKWEELSQVDRNAVVNALAGTRQREIVLTLFENWDQVEKFTQISADSYGTAEEKMTAFTDTIEAAQNRLTVAMERWVLTLQGSSAIKWFYDSLTFLVEQADKLIAVFGALAVIANWNKIWNNLGVTFTRVEAQAARFGTMLDRITAKAGAEGGFAGQVKSDAQTEFEAAYVSSQQKTYGDRLNRLAGTVGDKDVLAQLGALQNMFINSKDTKKGLEFFEALEDTGFQFTQELDTATNSIKDLTRQQQMAEYAQYYLTGAQKDSTGQILKQIQQGKISELTQQQLDEANAALAKARSQEYQQVNARMKANVQDWNQKGGVASAGSAAATGIMSLGASFGGSKAGSMIGSLFGESGEVIGMALGMIIAPALVQGLAKSLISGAASGTLGKIGTAIGTAIGTPIGGVIVAVLLGAIPFIADSILSKDEKLLEEAAEKFESESDKYSEMLNASAQTSEYDELVKGVDALGRNVSLTDEEYQQFLDTSNELAAVFPELIQYTDDQGNKFVGLNGKITGVTDAVNELVEAQQRATDKALLDPGLWAENYKTARDTYLDAKSSVESQEGMVEALNSLVGTGIYDEGIEGWLPSQISYKSSDIRSYAAQKYIDAFKEAGYNASATNEGFIVTGIDPDEEARVFAEVTAKIEGETDNLKNVLKEAQASISSEVDAIFREMAYSPKYASMFEDMESEVELLLRNIAGNVEFEEGMSEEGYREEIEQTVASVGDTLKKNPTIIQLWTEANEASTVSAVADVKEKLIDALEAAFPNMDWTSAKGGQILLSLGLEFDPNAGNGGAIVDAESTFTKLQQYITSIGSQLNGTVTAEWFNNLSMEAANQVFEYYRSGMATAITTQQQLEQMLVNDLANNVDMMLAQYQNMIAALPDFTNRLNSYLSSALAGGVIDKQAIQEYFSDLPDYVQNSIENTAHSLEESLQELPTGYIQDKAREAMDVLASGMTLDKDQLIPSVREFVEEYEEALQEGFEDFDADTLDVQKSIIESLNAETWGDLEIDGIVDTWAEMKTVLDDITDSYDKLAAAQKEYATYGRISYQTALDLLMTESSLASAMEVTKNGVELKGNAQEILAKAQLQLALSNLEVARTEIQEKIATAQAELQQLSTSNTVEKTVNIADDATTARINQLNLLNEAYALNTQYAMANAKAAYASAVGGDPALAGDAIADAGEQVTASTKAPTVQKAETGSYKVTTTYTEAERQARIRELEELVGHWDAEAGEWTSTGSLQDSDKIVEGMVNELRDTIEKGGDMTDFVNWYPTPDSSSSGSGSAEEAIMNAKDYLDQLKDLHDLIDKEWEAMVAFDEKTFTWTDTAYFDKMEDNLNKQLKELDRLEKFSDELFQNMGYDDTDHYFSLLEQLGEAGQYEELYKLKQSTEEALDKYGLSISDIYDIEKDRIEVQKELNNLDDEQVEDEISLLETRNASVYALLKAQEELIQTSDTEEELIERQADYNDLLEEEVELRRQIAQFEQDTAERASKYVSGQAYSNSMAYDTLINIQKQALQQQADLALEDYNREFNEAYAQYVSEGMDKSLAYQMAQRSEGAREALETYFDALEAQGDLVVESFEAKMNELETQLEELEMTKPEEWGHIEDINPYYDSMISNIKAQIAQVEEALQNTEMMTDEQIEEWVGKYNDLVQQLQETQKNALEDTTNYQDEQFNALVDWIEEYKQSIEDLKKDVEDYYEPLIDAAQKYADDVAEANDLLELQQNLLNAQKEKQRVYREGIGWVKNMPITTISVKSLKLAKTEEKGRTNFVPVPRDYGTLGVISGLKLFHRCDII